METPQLFPILKSTVTAMHSHVGVYPSLRYNVFYVLYQTVQDIVHFPPVPPKTVIQEDRNRRISEGLKDLGGYLSYADPHEPDEVLKRMQTIGEWISDYILPPTSLCCCHGSLPRTVEIITDQHEIPWELTWVQGNFLCRQVVHSRYPFISKIRSGPLAYQKIPNFVALVGRSSGLFSASDELNKINNLYKSRFGKEIVVLEKEDVTVDSIRNILRDGNYYGGPFDIIHFIGHGDSQADQVWLELLGPPFLDDHIPPVLSGNPLIFWNACYSGASTSRGYRYQADVVDTFGGRLLYSGASHFIGTLFPVLDQTAKAMAVTFYEHLFEGAPIGLAFFNAKSSLNVQDPLVDTYILYGNPEVRVV